MLLHKKRNKEILNLHGLAKLISDRESVPLPEACQQVSAVLRGIRECIVAGNSLSLRGFGRFQVKIQKPYLKACKFGPIKQRKIIPRGIRIAFHVSKDWRREATRCLEADLKLTEG